MDVFIAFAPAPVYHFLLLNLVPDGTALTFSFKLNEGYTRNFPDRPAILTSGTILREDLLLRGHGHRYCSDSIRCCWPNAERPLPSRTTFIWGLRSQHDLYYEDELSRLSRERPEHSHVITLSRPEPGWAGASGRVTTLIARQIQDVKQLAVYVCGNSGMIAEVTRIIQAKGLCPIFREKYYDDASVDSDE